MFFNKEVMMSIVIYLTRFRMKLYERNINRLTAYFVRLLLALAIAPGDHSPQKCLVWLSFGCLLGYCQGFAVDLVLSLFL